jgi:hypothetical protein
LYEECSASLKYPLPSQNYIVRLLNKGMAISAKLQGIVKNTVHKPPLICDSHEMSLTRKTDQKTYALAKLIHGLANTKNYQNNIYYKKKNFK